MAKRRALMIIVSCLVGLRAADAYAADPNRAAAFGWHGSVDTDLAFSEIRSGDFTLMATFPRVAFLLRR